MILFYSVNLTRVVPRIELWVTSCVILYVLIFDKCTIDKRYNLCKIHNKINLHFYLLRVILKVFFFYLKKFINKPFFFIKKKLILYIRKNLLPLSPSFWLPKTSRDCCKVLSLKASSIPSQTTTTTTTIKNDSKSFVH